MDHISTWDYICICYVQLSFFDGGIGKNPFKNEFILLMVPTRTLEFCLANLSVCE